MERVTISLDDDLLAQFDGYLKRKGYANRSEGIRDLLREKLEQNRLDEGKASHAIACLSYVYNHDQRELSRRLAKSQHAHHDLVLSTLHVHLDHENCLEIAVLKGRTADVQTFAEATMAETGVRHGNLHLVPSEMVTAAHTHDPDPDHDDHAHPHTHVHPKS
jgi:CopG family nickel-responsive transcriptional regulator